MDPEAVKKALEGSEIAYSTAGLPYVAKLWQEEWPILMHNVIEACKANGTKLVFFSNVLRPGQSGWLDYRRKPIESMQ